MRKLIIILIVSLSCITESYSQQITIGITIRTIHFRKVSDFNGQKYNNWNPGISIGYQTRDNVTFEAAVILNSYKKWTCVSAVGYRKDNFEIQIGGATGYKDFGQGWVRPGYFVNYYGFDGLKVKLNHEIINFGIYQDLKLNYEKINISPL